MLRAIDANINRAAEGLRVLEDVARFYFDDAENSAVLKNLRHELRAHSPAQALADRRIGSDIGIGVAAADENHRLVLADVILANAKRVEEAMRVLEELGKLNQLDIAVYGKIRYQSYDIEQKMLTQIPASRLSQAYVYVLIDCSLCADPLAMARVAQEAGAGIIQLRAKDLSAAEYLSLAKEMRSILNRSLFIVNDHVAVAKIVAADGVHLGQDDMSVADARMVLGPLAIIGLS
ncbi:MAG: thiamine phosphate synthase, partial [Planctomycetes bacterium]|nr:thiamine phosphate synthase [Planctomycetota bacterium]